MYPRIYVDSWDDFAQDGLMLWHLYCMHDAPARGRDDGQKLETRGSSQRRCLLIRWVLRRTHSQPARITVAQAPESNGGAGMFKLHGDGGCPRLPPSIHVIVEDGRPVSGQYAEPGIGAVNGGAGPAIAQSLEHAEPVQHGELDVGIGHERTIALKPPLPLEVKGPACEQVDMSHVEELRGEGTQHGGIVRAIADDETRIVEDPVDRSDRRIAFIHQDRDVRETVAYDRGVPLDIVKHSSQRWGLPGGRPQRIIVTPHAVVRPLGVK